MTETVMKTKALPDIITDLIQTEDVRVKKDDDGVIQLVPVPEEKKSALGLLGLLADCPEITVDGFMAEKQLEKELDL